MSLPTDPRSTLRPDPPADRHADRLVASAVLAAANAPAADCPEAELLALYAERELAGGDLTRVENHLDGCPRCQAIVAACVRALPDLSEASPVHAGALDTGTRGGSWFAGWRWLVPITSVAAVAMVAVWIGRGPADQVAQQAGSEGATRDERVSEFRSAAPAPPAPASADTAGARNALADGEREADAGRLAAARANDAAATSATAQQERRPLRREDAQAKAAAAEPAADVRQLSEAAPAAAPATAPSPVAIAPAPAEAAEAVRAPARDAAAAPAEAVRAPATATMSARASGAAAGGARNEVGAARKQASSILTGTVTYRARVALPAGAVMEVRLLDVSRADPTSLRAGAPADTLALAQIVTRGEQVPVTFSLSYDPDAIQSQRRYVVQATIAVEGRVTWRTTTQHPVFVDGAAPTGPVTIVVEQMR